MLILITLLAWATLLIPMPRWLDGILSFVVIGLGLVLVVLGGMAWYWDSHMRADADGGMTTLVCGALMLLSRIKHVLRLIAEILDSSY